jgi:hypothetical protein
VYRAGRSSAPTTVRGCVAAAATVAGGDFVATPVGPTAVLLRKGVGSSTCASLTRPAPSPAAARAGRQRPARTAPPWSPTRSTTTTCTDDFSARIAKSPITWAWARDVEYGPDNDVTTAFDALDTATTNGKATTYSYDAMFNPTKTTAPTGASSSTTYATPVHPLLPDTSTDEQDNRTSYTYDGPGNLTQRQDSCACPRCGRSSESGGSSDASPERPSSLRPPFRRRRSERATASRVSMGM